MNTFNIYCDESCHLEGDKIPVMVLGAIWCKKDDKEYIFERLREIKIKHKLPPSFEIKWNKVSPAKFDFYKDLINFFFDTEKLGFRALVVPDQNVLDHKKYHQTQDEFYYKMYFDMLKIIITPHYRFNIYLDIKDTKGFEKLSKLHEVISNENYDFSKTIIQRIQEVRSDEVSILQLTDLLIGAISYYYRSLESNAAKLELIRLIKKRSGYTLDKSTLPSEGKFNIFIWKHDYKKKKGE